MNILIIGGTGFLGYQLTKALLKGNQDVTLLNRGHAKDKVSFSLIDKYSIQIADKQLPQNKIDHNFN